MPRFRLPLSSSRIMQSRQKLKLPSSYRLSCALSMRNLILTFSLLISIAFFTHLTPFPSLNLSLSRLSTPSPPSFVTHHSIPIPVVATLPTSKSNVSAANHTQHESNQRPLSVPMPPPPPPSPPSQQQQEQQQQASPPRLSLQDHLNFSSKTAINFMHFHKTGGVSFKTSLHKFYHSRFKASGKKVLVRDACYSREDTPINSEKPSFLIWRCDWQPLHDMSESERNAHDFVFGHQFWQDGIAKLLSLRQVRSFTIMRHPFDRKVSFYYHFFVRELGRKESDVTFDEIRDFLLYDKLIVNASLGRDLGPNYMAGRLLSNGIDGFVGNQTYSYFHVTRDDKYQVAESAMQLIRQYIFVGLQTQSSAAKCMLRKVVEAFNHVNGVNNDGVDLIDDGAEVLNSGSYSLSAPVIWGRLNEQERIVFDKKERVDLMIYEEGVRLFKEHVVLFGCSHRIVETN